MNDEILNRIEKLDGIFSLLEAHAVIFETDKVNFEELNEVRELLDFLCREKVLEKLLIPDEREHYIKTSLYT